MRFILGAISKEIPYCKPIFPRNIIKGLKTPPEVKVSKNSKLPKLIENYFEPIGKGEWPSIST
jgi:hypothetical protein